MIRHCPIEIVQFARPENVGVARQDLLYKCRTRTRHADDKNWCPRWLTDVSEALEQLRSKHIPDALVHFQSCALIECNLAALERIACQQLIERALGLAQIFVGFGQREMKVDPIVDR